MHGTCGRAWQLRANVVWSQVRGSERAIERTQRSFEHLGVVPSLTPLTGSGGTVSIVEFDGDWVLQAGMTRRSPDLELNGTGAS